MALSDEDVAALAEGMFPDDPALPFWSSDIGPLRYYAKLLAAEVQRLRTENAELRADYAFVEHAIKVSGGDVEMKLKRRVWNLRYRPKKPYENCPHCGELFKIKSGHQCVQPSPQPHGR